MVRIWHDDIDGTPAVETLVFLYRGDWYEIDLSAANFARYEAAMEDFISCARKTAVEMVNTPVAPTMAPPVPPAPLPVPTAPVATAPPAPVAAAPAPPTPVAAPPVTPEAPPVEVPTVEVVTPAAPEPTEVSAEKSTSADGAFAPFARLVFEPEPDKIPVLAGVSVEAATNGSTNGRSNAVRYTKPTGRGKGSIPRPQRLTPEQCQVIREWAKTQSRFKGAKSHGRIPNEMYEAFVIAHSDGRL